MEQIDAGFLKTFLLAFIPLFVAMEPTGVMPVYVAMTRLMTEEMKRRVLLHSMITATAITLMFLFVGKAVFIALGITVSDFQIAGGLVLLSIAISDIVQSARGAPEPMPGEGVGIVPIGTPLIAGPAAITTLILSSDLYGLAATAAALFANLLILWFSFIWSGPIVGRIGENGTKGISKVISLLLAAIAVMMIRRGLAGLGVF